MTRHRHTSVVATLCVLLLLEVAGRAVTPPAETLYADAMAKEKAVRAALLPEQPPLTVLKAVRTVVGQYELLVRSYPTSGYCDNALWQAGQLSLDAFQKFREARDRDAALRLLRALASEYPTSKLAKQVPDQLARAARLGEPKVEPTTNGATHYLASAVSGTSIGTAAGIATIKDIRRAVLPDVVRITIELDAEVQFHEERLNDPPRVFVDMSPARAIPALVDQTLRFDGDTEVVKQIRLGRHPNNTTRIVLEAAGVSSFSVYPLYSPYRLVIDFVRMVPAASRPSVPVVALLAPSGAGAAPSSSGPRAVPPPPLLRSHALTIGPFLVPPPPAPESADLLAETLRPATLPVPAGEGDSLPAVSLTATATASPTAPSAALAPLQSTPPAPNLAGGLSIARQLGLSVSRIVIDPGHGGHDPGAKSPGVTEADLVLDIALRLEKLLVNVPGIEVVLTRRSDTFIPLYERTAIANREGADLFLSIHANANTDKLARGVESYVLSYRATNSSAQSVAARENSASGHAMGDLLDVLNAIALTNKLDESRDLAAMVQRAMLDKLQTTSKGVRNLGVKQAPFVVLIGASMPSVLCEVSFLTNAQDARLLSTSSYRQRIADALFAAIRKYQTSLKSTGTIAAQP